MNNTIVSNGLFLIYGASSCPNCEAVKKLLNQKNKQFVYKYFGEDYELQELTELVGRPTRSIPQIFQIGENNQIIHIGGLMGLVKHLKDS